MRSQEAVPLRKGNGRGRGHGDPVRQQNLPLFERLASFGDTLAPRPSRAGREIAQHSPTRSGSWRDHRIVRSRQACSASTAQSLEGAAARLSRCSSRFPQCALLQAGEYSTPTGGRPVTTRAAAGDARTHGETPAAPTTCRSVVTGNPVRAPDASVHAQRGGSARGVKPAIPEGQPARPARHALC
jgi:hypothetical protein